MAYSPLTPTKAANNIRKQGISFDKAVTVFKDPLAFIFDDETHSERENREIIIGISTLRRMILVCFVERLEDIVRIISARPATRQEIKDYEENAHNQPRKVQEMTSEYRFDYKKARPNRFAARMKDEPLIVMIEPDVAKVFTSAEQVNKALRALISAMPEKKTATSKVPSH